MQFNTLVEMADYYRAVNNVKSSHHARQVMIINCDSSDLWKMERGKLMVSVEYIRLTPRILRIPREQHGMFKRLVLETIMSTFAGKRLQEYFDLMGITLEGVLQTTTGSTPEVHLCDFLKEQGSTMKGNSNNRVGPRIVDSKGWKTFTRSAYAKQTLLPEHYIHTPKFYGFADDPEKMTLFNLAVVRMYFDTTRGIQIARSMRICCPDFVERIYTAILEKELVVS